VLAPRIRLAPGFSSENLRLALARHERCLAGGPGRVLKAGPRTRVTAVVLDDGRERIVKQYPGRGIGQRLEDALRAAPPLREWRAAERLAQSGVAAPAALALMLPPPLAGGSAYLVLEAIADAEPVNRYAQRRCASRAGRTRRLRLVDAVADHIRSLHERGIEHRDLKGSNLLVRERGEGFELFLVDLAEVRFTGKVCETHRVEALAQLNASTPLEVGPRERLRFLARYEPGQSRAARVRRFRAIERRSRQRGCVWDPGYTGHELADPPYEPPSRWTPRSLLR
jgi:tRNA A-37 threonylcarbamoyl transferase component Bud32